MQERSATPDFRLVGCDPDGRPDEPVGDLPHPIAEACRACSDLYKRVGYERPWVSYIALVAGSPVGGGAFVAPPVGNRVEVAYFTLPEHAGSGFATLTLKSLIAIARNRQPAVEIYAKTAPEANASTAVLAKLGFNMAGTTTDDEIGEAWAWLLV
jgi:[ribosomal protein S5]-alanine N-acetyltransferase